MRPNKKTRIIVSDASQGMPYSKGLMARSIMATGVNPSVAFDIAELIEDRLSEQNVLTLTRKELMKIAAETVREQVGPEYSQRYLEWLQIKSIDKPLIILLGGATGVGKSTIASEVAHRLGINRLISTDALREVMRVMLTEELMPSLYHSSFEAWKHLRVPPGSVEDPVIYGFREQVSAVSVSVKAIIERAKREQINMVIEGVHIVPGFFKLDDPMLDAFMVPILIENEDADYHRAHFYTRDLHTSGSRSFSRYIDNFSNIRRISEYIKLMAKEREVPVVDSFNLDHAVARVMELITQRVLSIKQGL